MEKRDIELWRQADQVFEALQQLPSDQRDAALRARQLDSDVASKVRELLIGDAQSTGWLDGDILFSPDANPMDEAMIGKRFGAWVVDEWIGRGGMASIYRVHREVDQLVQVAALKVLGGGQLSPDGLRRFQQEKQILAGLSHPNIARLLDAGVAEDGTPFFAMELIEGVPIDRYVNEHDLDTRDIARLFMQVCLAVAHAQRNLIVHRDLKPSNILVDHHGQAKLLDFGIARLLERRDQGLTTTRAFTPGYSAPEQVLGQPITTATDVFALGAVLYRLLSGHSAFPDKASRYQAPPLLRTVLPRLDSDLENVVAMALREEPERRYSNAQSLAEDLRSWLAQRPVMATPDSTGYRFTKFARRHRGQLIAGGLLLFTLGVGLVSTLWQANRAVVAAEQAERERAAAEATVGFLTSLFEQANPDISGGVDLSAQDMLDIGAQQLEQLIAEQPQITSRLLNTVGTSYLSMGQYQQAQALFERSLTVDREVDALYGLARAQFEASQFDDAVRSLDAAADLASPDTTVPLARLRGELLSQKGEFQLAEQHLNASLARHRNSNPRAHLNDLLALGRHHSNAGDYPRAQAVLSDAQQLAADLGHNGARALALYELAAVSREQSQFDQGVALIDQARQLLATVYGEGHPVLVNSYLEQVSLARALNRLDEAREAAEEGLRLARETLDEHTLTAEALNSLGNVVMDQGDYPQAADLMLEAIEVLTSLRDEPDVGLGLVHANLGLVYRYQGDHDNAEQHITEAYRIHSGLLEPTHPEMLHTRAHMAHMHRFRGRSAEAEQAYRSLAVDSVTALGSAHAISIGSNYNIARLLLDENRQLDESAKFFRRAFDGAKSAYPPESRPYLLSQLGLGQVLIKLNQVSEAEAVLADLHYELEPESAQPQSGRPLLIVALLREAQGEFGEARHLLAEAMRRFDQEADQGANDRPEALALQARLAAVPNRE